MTTLRPTPRRTAGFTVIEMVITLAIFAILLVAMLTLFDQSNKLARAQTHISDMQQSLRISIDEVARNARIAGRGSDFAPEFSVNVSNNPGGNLLGLADDALEILPNTDVLRIRGAITGSIYEVTTGNATSAQVVIDTSSPSGREQDVDAWNDVPVGDAMFIVSGLGETAIVAVTGVSVSGGSATIQFASTGGNADIYKDMLTGAGTGPASWLAEDRAIRTATIIEEYHYYVRANRVTPGDINSEARPRLSFARVVPGSSEFGAGPTPAAWNADVTNLRIDIADGILDFQLALGIDTYTIDTDGDGINDEGDGVLTDIGAGADDDEWFYNAAGDAAPPIIYVGGDLFYVRMSILARTQRRDFRYIAPAITGTIEDNDYSEKAVGDPSMTDAEKFDRSFHRRQLQAIIDLRNI